jgi:circadian clock protein KaiB
MTEADETPVMTEASSDPPSSPGQYVLLLFVTGQTTRSQRAVANLRKLCDRLADRCELTVVDVLERPQLAETEKVLATPTVIRQRPLPVRRVIGDLSDAEKVASWLDLPQEAMAP